eukprot:11848566-Prorocentrum_lima.AAC.1
MQRARPPAARLSAIRATKQELVLRRDKYMAEHAALLQQAMDKKEAASKVAIRLLELDQDESAMLQLVADNTPSRTPLGWPSGTAWPPPPLLPPAPSLPSA